MTDEKPFTHFAWDIEVPDLGEVWLRGEGPSGYPTQTWINGELVRREDRGEFAWAAAAGVPTPIYLMDRDVANYDPETACYLVKQNRELWISFLKKPGVYSPSFRAQCAAYVHYADTLLDTLGCTRAQLQG